MNELPATFQILKSLIAPARYSEGPTLYIIGHCGDKSGCRIYEQMPSGECRAWPEPPSASVQLAEGKIYHYARAPEQ